MTITVCLTRSRLQHTIFDSVLWSKCWSSDVFVVAMTMATIVRQSCSNVGAEGWGRGGFGSGRQIWSYSSAISAKDIDRRGSEATGQEGRKQALMSVSEKSEGWKKSYEF